MSLISETLVLATVDQPAGYTPPTPTLTLTDPLRVKAEVSIVASTVDNADAVVGLTALVAAVKAACDALLPTYGLDSSGNNLEAQYEMKTVVRNNGVSQYLDTDNYLVAIDVVWVKV